MAESLHGYDDIHEAAAGIFDALPGDPFGEGQDEDPAGTEEETPPAVEEATEDFDDEASEALTDDESAGDEEEDAEEEPEDESEDDEDEEDGSEDAEEPTVTVRVDGEDLEIPLSEALAGYSRTASWTKKSQALAAERKAFKAEQEAIQRERMEYGQKLQEVAEQIQANLPEKPSPNDPQAWIRYKEEMERLEIVQKERMDLHQRMVSDAEAQKQERIAQENEKLVELIPEWRDNDVALTEKRSLAKYAVEVLGFEEEDINNIVDHRTVMVLKKAAAWDALSEAKQKAKTKAKGAPVLQPGKSSKKASGRKTSRKAKSRRANLRESGRVQDAAAVIFDSLLDD
jgi:hypothetical protein